MIAKILCVLNLGYVGVMFVSFLISRFETAAFWGCSASASFCAQVLITVVFVSSRRALSRAWAIACGCSVILNLIVVALGVLFMNTFMNSR